MRNHTFRNKTTKLWNSALINVKLCQKSEADYLNLYNATHHTDKFPAQKEIRPFADPSSTVVKLFWGVIRLSGKLCQG
jgi:hypothetical protein